MIFDLKKFEEKIYGTDVSLNKLFDPKFDIHEINIKEINGNEIKLESVNVQEEVTGLFYVKTFSEKESFVLFYSYIEDIYIVRADYPNKENFYHSDNFETFLEINDLNDYKHKSFFDEIKYFYTEKYNFIEKNISKQKIKRLFKQKNIRYEFNFDLIHANIIQ